MMTMLTIPIAIPLMLFSMDIRKYPKMAGKTLLSMLFALVAVLDTGKDVGESIRKKAPP